MAYGKVLYGPRAKALGMEQGKVSKMRTQGDDQALKFALEGMADCLADYANESVGWEALEHWAGAIEFATYAADAILEEMGVV